MKRKRLLQSTHLPKPQQVFTVKSKQFPYPAPEWETRSQKYQVSNSPTSNVHGLPLLSALLPICTMAMHLDWMWLERAMAYFMFLKYYKILLRGEWCQASTLFVLTNNCKILVSHKNLSTNCQRLLKHNTLICSLFYYFCLNKAWRNTINVQRCLIQFGRWIFGEAVTMNTASIKARDNIKKALLLQNDIQHWKREERWFFLQLKGHDWVLPPSAHVLRTSRH